MKMMWDYCDDYGTANALTIGPWISPMAPACTSTVAPDASSGRRNYWSDECFCTHVKGSTNVNDALALICECKLDAERNKNGTDEPIEPKCDGSACLNSPAGECRRYGEEVTPKHAIEIEDAA